ncbi:MAG: Cell division protein ZapA [Deltaproteobacteria bacterium]|nr:Cell division protein ZapA [Deltaproteobacteria bacterium]
MANRFDVNIAGYALVVQTERSAAHMERLAETLNERVREIQKAGSSANYLNVVMLAAMELADDVLTTGDRVTESRKANRELEDRAVRLEEEVRSLRREVETLREEREGLREKVDRNNRDLLAVLENALKKHGGETEVYGPCRERDRPAS